MACDKTLTSNFLKNCNYYPASGIEELYLINYSDIDRAATQIDTNGNITDLVLKTGKKGYRLEGNAKTGNLQVNGVSRDLYDGFEHVVEYKVMNLDEKARQNLQALTNGARVVALVKKADAGQDGASQWEVAGYDTGLKRAEYQRNVGEGNVGALTLKTDEKAAESYEARLFKPATGTVEDWIANNITK